MLTLQVIIVLVYTLLLLFIFMYSMMQANLVYHYVKSRQQAGGRSDDTLPELMVDAEESDPNTWPFVTVQLPIYNEKYVIERLIDAVADFDYPKDRFEIQVLDDSTDETVDITAQKVAKVKLDGYQIQHVRRENRAGFKAGALKEGLLQAKGEYVAIFDADFVPKPEFLKRTIPHFSDDRVGVVQTRWEHINRDYSLLTELQAFGLDAHFSVEQRGRNAGGHFINFNGTAGIWRKACIEDAGGWESDTLTEDLDLSYRAQLKGWKFRYLENLGSPAELPAAMNALKTQQYRWTKGAAECTRKNLPKVIKAKGLPFGTRLHAVFHLSSSFLFVCILVTALLSVPLLFIKKSLVEYAYLFQFGTVFLLSLLSLSIFYYVSTASQRPGRSSLLLFMKRFPVFLSVSMGLSLHNAIAVIEGYIGKKTPFVRTPKFNIQQKQDSWRRNKYLSGQINGLTIVEALLALYFLSGIAVSVVNHDFALLPFHLMLALGFSMVAYYSFKHARALIR